jgi:hypothetical protein
MNKRQEKRQYVAGQLSISPSDLASWPSDYASSWGILSILNYVL